MSRDERVVLRGSHHDFVWSLKFSQELPMPVVFLPMPPPYPNLAVHTPRSDHLPIGAERRAGHAV